MVHTIWFSMNKYSLQDMHYSNVFDLLRKASQIAKAEIEMSGK